MMILMMKDDDDDSDDDDDDSDSDDNEEEELTRFPVLLELKVRNTREFGGPSNILKSLSGGRPERLVSAVDEKLVRPPTASSSMCVIVSPGKMPLAATEPTLCLMCATAGLFKGREESDKTRGDEGGGRESEGKESGRGAEGGEPFHSPLTL